MICRYDICEDFLKRNTGTQKSIGSGYFWTMKLSMWNGKETVSLYTSRMV